MSARSRIVRSHSSNWPSRRQSSTIAWIIARIFGCVGSTIVRDAASTASAIIRIAVIRVPGFGPGWRYSISGTAFPPGSDFVSAFW